MFEEKDARILNELGLTILQARVYLSLVQIGKASANTISDISGIDRSETYRTILALQKQGFVEQTIGFPSLYEAIPLKDGIRTLLKQKEDYQLKICDEANSLIQKCVLNEKRKTEEKASMFVMIPIKDAVVRKVKNELRNAHREVDILTNTKRFSQVIDYFFLPLKRILEQDLKVRLLTEKSEYQASVYEKLGLLFAMSNFEARCFFASPTAAVSVFDAERAIIVVDQSLGLRESSVIWTNHPGLVAILQEHFDRTWIQAIELKIPKTKNGIVTRIKC